MNNRVYIVMATREDGCCENVRLEFIKVCSTLELAKGVVDNWYNDLLEQLGDDYRLVVDKNEDGDKVYTLESKVGPDYFYECTIMKKAVM